MEITLGRGWVGDDRSARPPYTRRPPREPRPPAARCAPSRSARRSPAPVAAGAVLLGCMALGLVGWFASDAGGHGTTRDAIRVGADGWLLAHGAHLHLPPARSPRPSPRSRSGSPCSALYVALPARASGPAAHVGRRGRPAASRSATVVLAGVYGVVALVMRGAGRDADRRAGPAAARSPAASRWPASAAAPGSCAGSARRRGLARPGARDALRAIAHGRGRGGAAAGRRRRRAAGRGRCCSTSARPRTCCPGCTPTPPAGCSTPLLVAAVAPNAVLLSGSYLLGPGFAVGTGTLVSPPAVVARPGAGVPAARRAARRRRHRRPGRRRWSRCRSLVAVVGGGAACQRRTRRSATRPGALRGLGSRRARPGCCSTCSSRSPAAPSAPAGWPTSAPPLRRHAGRTPSVALGVGGLRRRRRLPPGGSAGTPARASERRPVVASRRARPSPRLASSCSSPAPAPTCRRCSTPAPTRRTAPRWSPSAPTATASRGWRGPSGPASRRSCTGSKDHLDRERLGPRR